MDGCSASAVGVMASPRRESIELMVNHLGEYVPSEGFPKRLVSKDVARRNLRSATGQDFGFDVPRWRNWLDSRTDEELEAELEAIFWSDMAKHGLPWLRCFRRPITVDEIESSRPAILNHPDWSRLKSELKPGGEIWPFRYPRWNTIKAWGFRIGYLVLRQGTPVGGVVTMVS